jgi:phosphoglucosamine mutase
VKPKLFGSSGIRGLANVEITTTLAQRVGAALATMHEGGGMVVGRDPRVTGPMLESALLSGLAAGGADALVFGLVPTPVTAWMIRETGSDAGVEITASHNPPRYNGFKVFNDDGMSFTNREQLELERIMEEGAYRLAPWDCVGAVDKVDAVEPYADALGEALDVSWDGGAACDLFCGATCVTAPRVFEELGVQAEFINAVPDGRFPAGDPEPNAETLRRLGGYMRARGISIGFGFDGDGDRMMPVGSDGATVSPDRVLAAYAGYAVERSGGGVVVTHVGASMSVDDMVEAAGGRVIRTPVGDAFVTEAVVEHGAVFGGEPVGAWVFPEVHMCPDGVLSALKLIEALGETETTLEEFVEPAPSYPLGRAKLECPDHLKQEAMNALSEGYVDSFHGVKDVSTVDGVRLEVEEGWVLVRPSGTEPLIRVTVEGRSREDMEALMLRAEDLVKKVLGGLK